MKIELRLGIQFEEPEELLIYYFNKAGKGAQSYDKARFHDDTLFTECQIRQLVDLISHFGGMIRSKKVKEEIIKGLIQKKREIELILMDISSKHTILDKEEEIPWQKIVSLFNECRIKQVGLTRMTKILHKKRPDLIPILDKIVVCQYLEPILKERGIITHNQNERAIFYIKELKYDIEINKDDLLILQQSLKSKGYGVYDMSLLRLLDILIWSHFFYKEHKS
jgi:hypothetical protein